MKKKFTVQDILNFNPCEEYTEDKITELFKSVGCKKYVTVVELFKADIPHNDFFWLILRPEFIPERQLHEIAIWCFEEIAQPVWEKYYPDDKRPQEAIRIKKLWLDKKDTDDELAAAAYAAANAAAYAADRARDAAYAANAAAYAAARAANAAYAAADAADAAWAARDAAWAAAEARAANAAYAADRARDAAWDKIKNHIKKVCEKLNKKEEK